MTALGVTLKVCALWVPGFGQTDLSDRSRLRDRDLMDGAVLSAHASAPCVTPLGKLFFLLGMCFLDAHRVVRLRREEYGLSENQIERLYNHWRGFERRLVYGLSIEA